MKKNRGFTLFELIAVLAIISIVSAIAVPKIFNTINNSRRVVCFLNRDQIVSNYNLQLVLNTQLSFEDYLNDTGVYFEKEVKCPKGESYTYEDNKLVCPIHGIVYVDIKEEEYIYYPFFDNGFNNSLIDNIIFHDADTWDFVVIDGVKYYSNITNGENRFLLENNLESYKITSNVRLEGNNGYGIIFDSDTNNVANDTSYIFQFDYGYADGDFVFRERTNGNEHSPFKVIHPNDVYNSFDPNSYWNTEHKVAIEVVKISDTQKRVKVYIDGVEITEDEVVLVDIIESDTKYFGFRTWGPSKVYIRDVRIDKIS